MPSDVIVDGCVEGTTLVLSRGIWPRDLHASLTRGLGSCKQTDRRLGGDEAPGSSVWTWSPGARVG